MSVHKLGKDNGMKWGIGKGRKGNVKNGGMVAGRHARHGNLAGRHGCQVWGNLGGVGKVEG